MGMARHPLESSRIDTEDEPTIIDWGLHKFILRNAMDLGYVPFLLTNARFMHLHPLSAATKYDLVI